MAKYRQLGYFKRIAGAAFNLRAGGIAEDEEVNDYVNEAINIAELELHTLSLKSDYFLSLYNTTHEVNESGLMSLPPNIYANKIRTIEFLNYENHWSMITQIDPGFRKLNRITNRRAYQDNLNTSFNYILKKTDNDLSEPSPSEIYLAPVPTKALNVNIWYTRDAKELTKDSDYCDLPEFSPFIIRYLEFRLHKKKGNFQKADSTEAQAYRLLDKIITVLAQQTPDLDNRISGKENLRIMANQNALGNEVYE